MVLASCLGASHLGPCWVTAKTFNKLPFSGIRSYLVGRGIRPSSSMALFEQVGVYISCTQPGFRAFERSSQYPGRLGLAGSHEKRRQGVDSGSFNCPLPFGRCRDGPRCLARIHRFGAGYWDFVRTGVCSAAIDLAKPGSSIRYSWSSMRMIAHRISRRRFGGSLAGSVTSYSKPTER
jgi:hypothetical protein